MTKVIQLYRLFNLLSLDVVAGAVVCTIFFARLFNVPLKFSGLIALGLTVWIIYTADHLLDAKRVKHDASTERHRFHQKYFKALIIVLITAVVLDALQLFFIRRPVLIGGFMLAFVIAGYLFVQRYLKYLKEFFAALLYSGGVLLVPVSMCIEPLTIAHTTLIVVFFNTALLNLLLFSWFDHTQDEQDHRQSFATVLGKQTTKKAIWMLFMLNTIFMLFVTKTSIGIGPVLILGIMNVVMVVVMIQKDYFCKNDNYRLIGDAVFLVPAFYVFFS